MPVPARRHPPIAVRRRAGTGHRPLAFARAAGIDPVLPALGATMGASLGFMLPVSTPCNAIVYGSGRIPLRAMMRYGIALDVVGVATIVVVVTLLGPLVLGHARP